ncbi:uncharacterized protein FOMMEDRAFT_31114 [Fomitiporia mediterranea MF3/22]|uniref:uncharacterized protein n=1 Tax=Fomitiporia mediterranea (strain MF3/22) TaxID=694068 RepID=UPI00044084F2|nr:uncharacterized protein FOMMEDRAFT_31114 [Fomitiporia mediterranea MF3/22]EJC99883.1 hypothetical protein FOMMEDRAFT_31114 [Fomitiporia mediterranea MF3/22]
MAENFSVQDLQLVRLFYEDKEHFSIEINKLYIIMIRRRSGNEKHRGHEYIWYWTWDITINKTLICYGSLTMVPQPRLTGYFDVAEEDGEERLKTRIPDFGIIRHVGPRVVTRDDEEEEEPPYSRLVGVGEIKPAPVDGSTNQIELAVSEATSSLRAQLGILFIAYPEISDIVGISIAGEYWTFETMRYEDFEDALYSDDSNASYMPSDEPSSDPLNITGPWHSSSDPPDEPGSDGLPQHSIYRLQTSESNAAINHMIDDIKNLSACGRFEGAPF